MKKFSKILALLLAAMMVMSLVACGSKNTEETTKAAETTTAAETTKAEETDAPEETEDEVTTGGTLVYATSTFGQKFSPFFYTTVYDGEVADKVTGYLLAADRGGAIINNGIEGETINYNGTDYTYYGLGDIEVVQNDDGTVDYNLTMRDDVVFSDGVPATIDDVIFGIYVCCDPMYDGSSTLYALPIEGMDAYRSGMDSLFNLLLAAGEDNTDFTNWDEATQTAFWAEYHEAGAAFAQGIIDYCVDNYIDYAESYIGATADEVTADEALQVKLGMFLWGFDGGWFEGATASDYWDVIVAAYDGDIATADSKEAGYTSFYDSFDTSKYEEAVAFGDGAANISGITKTGDYSMTIHMTSYDATAIYSMSFIVAPMHYYGDASLYDYNNNSFGFKKGDLSGVKAKTSAPMGCGPYVFEGYDNGVVTLKANENYYLGAPKIETILMQESVDSDYVPGIISGSFDVASPSISNTTLMAIKDGNSNGELVGDTITTYLVDYRGYGYIGVSAELVKIGDDAGSDASKALRKGFMTLFSVYRDTVINSYYGDRASVIQYPISNTSWAAPKPADEGYEVAYSKDADGNQIYTDGMTDEQKYEAAKEAAITWFKAAGFTYDEAAGKFTDVTETYEVMIPGQGEQDHPAYGIVVAASEVLAELGITLQVNDVGTSTWNNALEGNTAMMWAAAWQSSVDPDMTQVYTSGNYVTGTNSNHYAIRDTELDSLIAQGRASADTEERKSIYKNCFDIVLDWGVELPTYQRKDCVTVSSQRIDTDTVPGDLTPYYGVFAELEKLATK